jgi:hypothetical protein
LLTTGSRTAPNAIVIASASEISRAEITPRVPRARAYYFRSDYIATRALRERRKPHASPPATSCRSALCKSALYVKRLRVAAKDSQSRRFFGREAVTRESASTRRIDAHEARFVSGAPEIRDPDERQP